MIPSLIRTVVPFVVALVAPWVLRYTGVTTDQLSSVLTVVLGGAYYAVVRVVEARWPSLGWLLGYPAQPTYDAGSGD